MSKTFANYPSITTETFPLLMYDTLLLDPKLQAMKQRGSVSTRVFTVNNVKYFMSSLHSAQQRCLGHHSADLALSGNTLS